MNMLTLELVTPQPLRTVVEEQVAHRVRHNSHFLTTAVLVRLFNQMLRFVAVAVPGVIWRYSPVVRCRHQIFAGDVAVGVDESVDHVAEVGAEADGGAIPGAVGVAAGAPGFEPVSTGFTSIF